MRLPHAIANLIRPATDDPVLQGLLLSERAHNAELKARLADCERRAKERGELLYELQKQYASEHFSLQEAMRNLKIERMRNAGLFGNRDIILGRAGLLQKRIAELKKRLRHYESLDDDAFDERPIALFEQGSDDLPAKSESDRT